MRFGGVSSFWHSGTSSYFKERRTLGKFLKQGRLSLTRGSVISLAYLLLSFCVTVSPLQVEVNADISEPCLHGRWGPWMQTPWSLQHRWRPRKAASPPWVQPEWILSHMDQQRKRKPRRDRYLLLWTTSVKVAHGPTVLRLFVSELQWGQRHPGKPVHVMGGLQGAVFMTCHYIFSNHISL